MEALQQGIDLSGIKSTPSIDGAILQESNTTMRNRLSSDVAHREVTHRDAVRQPRGQGLRRGAFGALIGLIALLGVLSPASAQNFTYPEDTRPS